MEPLSKTASRNSSKRSTSGESGDAEQHGRFPASLSAERAAATLRQSAPHTLDKSTSAPDLLHRKSSSSSVPDSPDSQLSPSQTRPQTSHVPNTPSPLNNQSSLNMAHGASEASSDKTSSERSKASPPRPQASAGPPASRRLAPPRPHMRQPRFKSTPEPSHFDSLSSSSPLAMRGVGSDYSRYFNPFSDSARSSFVEIPASPLPRLPSSTSPVAASGLSLKNPFITPNASTTKVNADYDAEKSVAIVDEKAVLSWPLITDQEEDDDDMHLPQPDDDMRFKPLWKDHFRRENISSTIGLFLMVSGLLFVFVALPVLSAVGVIDYNSMYDTPLDQMPNFWPKAEPWALVNNRSYPMLQNIRRTLIDRDTPKSAMTKKGAFGDDFELVFSDEFNQNNRTFYEGDDPFWFAPDIWYGATQDLDWYDPDAVTTWDGTLELRLDKFINHGLQFRSGMLNSWNHLCFKGGIFEVSVSLPGPAAVMGLWPGAWTMGNLGRPGYLSTTDGLWPYTYQNCDVGITPNQSSYDGLSRLPGQKLPSCTCPGEDHPSPGTGRGAPEIDIIEAGASYGGLPIATQSYQVAPFDIWYYPDYNFTAFPDYGTSYTNGYTGGPFQQAISATTNLNKNWYDGKAYQSYSFEYAPGEGKDAYIVWKVGGQTTFMMDGRAIGPNGNIGYRQVSKEPMSLILNLGISNSWTAIDWEHLVFPTVMRIDYVRWYQKKGAHSVTCDPPGYETTQYIKDHMSAYTNPNFTKWSQTGYDWPKHKLNTDC